MFLDCGNTHREHMQTPQRKALCTMKPGSSCFEALAPDPPSPQYNYFTVQLRSELVEQEYEQAAWVIKINWLVTWMDEVWFSASLQHFVLVVCYFFIIYRLCPTGQVSQNDPFFLVFTEENSPLMLLLGVYSDVLCSLPNLNPITCVTAKAIELLCYSNATQISFTLH